MNTVSGSTPPTCATNALDAPSRLTLEPGLDDAQRAAVLSAVADAQQRIAELLALSPGHGGLAPLHFAVDTYRKEPGIGAASLAARTLAYLAAEIGAQPGTRYADAICAAREAGVILARAGMSPEQAEVLREDLAQEICRPAGSVATLVGELVATRGFDDWETLRAALDFPEASAQWVLAELRFLAEQTIALLHAKPVSGLASPVDYMARLVAAGDTGAEAAVTAYLEEQVEPRFGKTFTAILREVEASRADSLGRGLSADERARLRAVFRQNVLSITLPDQRWKTIFEARVERLKSRDVSELFAGDERLAWHQFCEGLLLDSVQEARMLAVARALQRDVRCCGSDVDRAIPIEAAARAEIHAFLRPEQLARWEAFAERSLCSIDLPQ